MRRVFATTTFLTLLAIPALAQSPADPGQGQRRFTPPPDHWMTIDSLGQALGLSAAERTKITPSYTALNA
jgi:hypothetical protein